MFDNSPAWAWNIRLALAGVLALSVTGGLLAG